MGVWIETSKKTFPTLSIKSHPVWVCGLKHQGRENVRGAVGVTPCMGVWIETVLGDLSREQIWSHPVWVCGLKRHTFVRVVCEA